MPHLAKHRITPLIAVSWVALHSGACVAGEDLLPPADDVASLTEPIRVEPPRTACEDDPRVLLGLVTLETCTGADLFFRETFDGNDRTCGSCHPAHHNFTIDAEFIATLNHDDPLFVSEYRPELEALELPELLRDHGLVRVNADGFDDLTNKFVMRSVSHTLSLATSVTPPPPGPDPARAIDLTPFPPNHRTGWGGDGAPGNGELLDFTEGAIVQHGTRSLTRALGSDFRLPTEAERAAITSFMFNLGRKNELDLRTVQLTDAAAERGRVSFLSGAARDCSTCHFGAGANTVLLDSQQQIIFVNFTFDVGTEAARLPVLSELGIPFDGGFGVRPLDRNGDGVTDAFGNGAFNTPPLIEAADTGPFFHTNSAETIEDAIRFYTTPEFGRSPAGGAPALSRPEGGPFDLDDAEIDELGRLLRVLNAAFNLQQAIVRIEALQHIDDAYGRQFPSVQRGLIELTKAEVSDALRVLRDVPDLNTDVQASLTEALCRLNDLVRGMRRGRGQANIGRALTLVRSANAALGEGMAFDIGEGTLMF